MKIINDHVFGFIRIPEGLLLDIVNHPAFLLLAGVGMAVAGFKSPSSKGRQQ